MSLIDAQKVQKHLEEAQKAAVPMGDKELTKKINEASEHITRRIDPNEKTSAPKKE